MLLLLPLSITPLLAQKTWISSGSGSWNTAGNWSPNGVPTASDEVVIPAGTATPVIESGVTALAKYVEVQLGASLSISNGGSLSVVGSKVISDPIYTAAFQNLGTVNTSGLLSISSSVSKTYGIVNDGAFTINGTGEVQIDNTNLIGFWNRISVLSTASVTNSGKFYLGGTASLGAAAIYNEVAIRNNAGGELKIDRASSCNINNRAGSSFVNSGTIAIGQTTNSSGPGIYNFSTFNNQATGVIKIDRTSTAIFNLIDTGPVSFTNAGSIQIGQQATVNGPGIHNLSSGSYAVTFINTSGADIRADRSNTGIYNENTGNATASFTNSGTIHVGQANVINSAPGIHNIARASGSLTFQNTSLAEIKIDRVSTGLQNEAQGPGPMSCTNAGKIHIGQTGPLTSVGLLNTSYSATPIVTFTNTGGAELLIDNASVGLQNESPTTFTNAGSIKIGTTSTQSFYSPGITNKGNFTNQSTGLIAVERVNTSAIHHSQNTLTNSGTITIGISATAGGSYAPSFLSSSTVVNGTGAVLQIDNCTRGGIHSSSLFTNAGLIDIGKNGSGGVYGLQSSATLSNQVSGTITIDHISGSNSWGLFSYYGSSLTNDGIITIGRSYSGGQTGLYNYSTFTNSGSITIDHITPNTYSVHGLYNASGTFTNTGLITMGTSSTLGDWGLYNVASFSNNSGGEIRINRAGITGLRNESGGNFTNSGKVAIGATAGTGQWGLWNQGQFTNNSDLTVDNVTITGLRNQGNTFTNSGTIKVGSNSSSGSWGFWNEGTFNNLNGSISVDRATEVNFENAKGFGGTGVFINKASLSISTGTPATLGFYNEPGATFSNSACAALTLYDNLSNVGGMTNQGIMIVNTSKPHSNTGITNDGVISYLQANAIPNITNNDLIIAPISSNCGNASSTVLQVGGSNSFSVATTWYKDAALTQPAGTYDAGSNTFTASGLNSGLNLLYFAVTDNVTNCVKTASVALQVAGSATSATIQNVSVNATLGSPNCAVELNGQVSGTVFTFTGPNGYVFSNVYRKAGTYTLNGFRVTEPGVYTLTANVTGDCGLGTPVTQTITVSGTKCP
ncbi:beta strand repeat-containing protein [Arsenicibacter rosenii]|uniref:Ig-like domain-containing protein n=1 Tax=Arsenicibacter rosenii TaxID=1750698 RepID=A0A1S2VQJ7_9BACT|nr:hypothetical protein [Arsenicibacter rosenii]OIN61041.1 hypothetical protein BLX24_02895 [Arsenicibacter rosenii]